MGYIKHYTIVVTGWRDEDIEAAREKAVKIFGEFDGSEIVSQIVSGLTNGQKSFFIAPDGSKRGWETSNNCNDARKYFLDWLEKSDNYCYYIEIIFGGDDEYEAIVRSKEIDLSKLKY